MPPSHKSPAPACGSKISPSHSHKPECPAASSGGRTPNPSRDSFRSSREGPSRRSPPPQTAPDASPVATRLPTEAEEIRSGGQSCGNYSSGRRSLQMENHRTDSIPNDSYPVKSDRLLGAANVAVGSKGEKLNASIRF